MESAVIDFQAFTGLGTTKFIVKEVSITDLDTLDEHNFLFKPPSELPPESGRSYCDRWLKKHHHHLEWSQGNLEYFTLEDVLVKATKKYKFLFGKGKEKCDFLEDLLRRYVYDLQRFGCPGLKKLAADMPCCDKCPHHTGQKYVCAHQQALELAKWAVSNKDKIDLRDPEVRLSTFSRWGVIYDPSRLSLLGFIHIPNTRSGIRCVYCGLEILKVSSSDREDPQEVHRANCPDCDTFKAVNKNV